VKTCEMHDLACQTHTIYC